MKLLEDLIICGIISKGGTTGVKYHRLEVWLLEKFMRKLELQYRKKHLTNNYIIKASGGGAPFMNPRSSENIGCCKHEEDNSISQKMSLTIVCTSIYKRIQHSSVKRISAQRLLNPVNV